MNNFFNRYEDFEFNNNYSNVAFFVTDEVNISNTLFNSISSIGTDYNILFYLIDMDNLNYFQNDLINKNISLLDLIIIHGMDFDLDFLEILVHNCNLFDIKLIFEISDFDEFKVFDSNIQSFLLDNVELFICSDELIDKSQFKHILMRDDLFISPMDSINNFDDSISFWFNLFYSNFRNKKSILYSQIIQYNLNRGDFDNFEEFIKYNSINIIDDSNLFDCEWYLDTYSDVKYLDISPITHYLKFGVDECCNPTPFFSNERYLSENTNVFCNPFVHFLLYNNENAFKYYSSEFYINPKDYEKNMEIIVNSNLFDDEYYLNTNLDVKNSGINPLDHWIKYGFSELKRNPFHHFDNYFYYNHYLINDSKKWNPLTHYILLGKKLGYKINPFDSLLLDYSYSLNDDMFNILSSEISIILIVFDFSSELIDSIDSIFNHTHLKFNLILLVNNQVPREFDFLFDMYDIQIEYYDETNFIDIFNHIIANSYQDIAILNNYSIVSNNWLIKLIIKAYSLKNIAVSLPLSNLIINIDSYKDCNNPSFLFNLEGINDIVNKSSFNHNIPVDYISPFCFFIKKDFINQVHFSYDDFCFNRDSNLFLIKNIFEGDAVIDDSTYIQANVDLFNSHNKLLDNINKMNFKHMVFPNLSLIKSLKNDISYVFEKTQNENIKNRILFILSDSDSLLTKDFLFKDIISSYDCYFLYVNETNLSLFKNGDELVSWNSVENNFINNKLLRDIYFNIIYSLKIDCVQLNTFVLNSFDLLDICKLFDIPIFLYCDDLFYIDMFLNQDNDYNILYKRRCLELFDYSNILLSNNDVFDKYAPFISSNNLVLDDSFLYDIEKCTFNIEHFDDLIKILVLGNLTSSNYKFIVELSENSLYNINFYFLFEIPDELKDFNNVYFYSEEYSFEKFFNEISPDFIYILNIWPEIFDIIDTLVEIKIPILINNDKDIFDCFEGILNFNTICTVEEFLECINPENYYNLIKDKVMDNSIINKKINEFSFNLLEVYSKFDNDKIIMKDALFSNLNKNNENFSNFDGFLANSYVSPIINVPFIEENKRCFAVMDNIAKYLINNVNDCINKPFISIVMYVYNNKYLIEDTIKSIFNQSYKSYELIIIDDNSVDGSGKILYSFNDERIKFIFNDYHQGYSKSINNALNNVTGDYVMYLKPGNIWANSYVESMVGAFLELPDADAIYSGQLIYKEQNYNNPIAIKFASFNKSLLHNHNFIDLNSFSHKRGVLDKINGFDESLVNFQDWDFILRINKYFNIYSIPILLSKKCLDYQDSFFNYANHIHSIKKIQNKLENDVYCDYNILNHKVSIIIPSFESLCDLKKCIESIISFDYGDFVKIIVVDNNSSNAVRLYLTWLYDNGVIDLIQNDINYGFTYAVNQGIFLSDSNSDILIMNNDSILTENAIKSMQNVAYGMEDCGIVVPQQVLPGGTHSIDIHVPYAIPIFDCDVNPSKHHNNILNVPLFHKGILLELNFAPFFCVYIKRDVLSKSLGLDAELGRHYRSDRIFSDYIRHVLNLKIYHTSDAIVYHKLQASTNKLKENKSDFDIMFKKNQWEDSLSKILGFDKALWDE